MPRLTGDLSEARSILVENERVNGIDSAARLRMAVAAAGVLTLMVAPAAKASSLRLSVARPAAVIALAQQGSRLAQQGSRRTLAQAKSTIRMTTAGTVTHAVAPSPVAVPSSRLPVTAPTTVTPSIPQAALDPTTGAAGSSALAVKQTAAAISLADSVKVRVQPTVGALKAQRVRSAWLNDPNRGHQTTTRPRPSVVADGGTPGPRSTTVRTLYGHDTAAPLLLSRESGVPLLSHPAPGSNVRGRWHGPRRSPASASNAAGASHEIATSPSVLVLPSPGGAAGVAGGGGGGGSMPTLAFLTAAALLLLNALLGGRLPLDLLPWRSALAALPLERPG